MKTTVCCRTTGKGIHTFYVLVGNNRYFLFNQNFKRGVDHYYGQGVSLKDAVAFSRAHGDRALIKTMSKIPNYIKYIEKEYDIEILEQTRRRHEQVVRRGPRGLRMAGSAVGAA